MEEIKNKKNLKTPISVDYEEKYNQLKEFSENLIKQLENQKTQEQKVEEERNLFMMYKRMDYLFQILKMSNKFPDAFIEKCKKEVIQVLNFDEDETK